MYEVGQLVRIRERTWEVLDDRASGSSGDHVLKVRGQEKDVQGKEYTFIYRPGSETADESSPGVERIMPLPSPELRWNPGTLPSRWERLHTAYRLSIAHNPDCLLSLSRARLVIEPYQLDPVLRIMKAPYQRFLLAEDVGMGKTIEAGLIMMELIARDRADRILIVVPAALQDQWSDEMYDKFGLSFQIIDNESLTKDILPNMPPGANPWTHCNRVITSIDFVKRERILRALKKTRWDMVIVDEAHYLSESGSEQKVERTLRSRFGEEIASICEHLLLLTATPHNGYAQGFYSLLRLLDNARFPGPDALERRSIQEVVIRRSKKDIYDENGHRKFQTRTVNHITLSIDDPRMKAERKLYTELVKYANQQWRAARHDSNQRVTVGFAMTLLKKRFISSPAAIRQSLETRKKNLNAEPLDKQARLLNSSRKGMPMTEQEKKRAHDLAMAQTTARDPQALARELEKLDELLRLAEQITPEKDYKAACLKARLDEFCLQEQRKVIVFTEYKDTLDYLKTYLEERGYQGRLVTLHGEMNRVQRLAAEQQFHRPETCVLLATDAASEGLNLQKDCWTVIHNELPWNPNRLEQRNGRVDRWGQRHTVEVHNVVLEGTLEAHILDRLMDKLKTIRDQLEQAPDVLSIADQAGIDELDMRLMEAAYELGDTPTPQAFATMTRQIEDELNERLTQAQAQQQEWLARMSIARDIFGKEKYQEIATIRQNTGLALPRSDEVEEFAVSTLRALGGRAEPVKDHERIWRLEIPASLLREGVKQCYERATFVLDIAQHNSEPPSSPDYLEYISLGHPLLEGLIAAVKIDAREGGSLAGRMAVRVLNDARRGMLFTFLGRWQDQRGVVVAEEIVPLFLPLKPPSPTFQDAHVEAQRLLAQNPLPRNASPALLDEEYRPRWQDLSLHAKDLARQYCQHYIERVRKQLLPQLEILEHDLEIWAAARYQWVKQQLEQKERTSQDQQLSLFDYRERQRALDAARTRLQNELAREQKSIENRKKERMAEISQMKQIAATMPELIGTLIIVPDP
jgi:superfamily II DNA or RNA helicase